MSPSEGLNQPAIALLHNEHTGPSDGVLFISSCNDATGIVKLRAGNIDGALTAITPDMRATYQQVFDGIPNLPAAVDQLGTIADGLLDRRYAQFVILRPSQDGEGYDGYDVYFLRGADGIWRIDSM